MADIPGAGGRAGSPRRRRSAGMGRFAGGSPAGRLGVGAVVTVLLAAAAFVASEGAASMAVSMRENSAWLASEPQGSVTLVDGFVGRPSAEAALEGAAGHPLQVTQEGDDVLVYDEVTGVLSRLDTGRLAAGEARSVLPGVRLMAGPGAAYLVDQDAGTVQAIDPGDLSSVGPLVKVPGRFGQSGVDAAGTLWLPRSDRGDVVPVTPTGLGTPVTGVGDAGSDLSMSIVGGRPVAVDERSGRVSLLGADGVQWRADTAGTSGGDVVAPTSQEGDDLAVLDRATGSVTVVDLDRRRTERTVTDPFLARPGLGAPVINGGQVYTPDYDGGQVLVYSPGDGSWASAVPVTGRPGTFETVQKDGVLYFNDPKSERAVTISGDSSPATVNKHEGISARAHDRPAPRQTASATATTAAPGTPPGPGTGDRPGPSAPPSAQRPPAGPLPAVGAVPVGPSAAGPSPAGPGGSATRTVPASPSVTSSAPPVGVPTSAVSGPAVAPSPSPTPAVTATATPTAPRATGTARTSTAAPRPTATARRTATPSPTKPAVPLAPQGVKAASGSGTVTVSWTAPRGGGAVRSYRVSWTPAAGKAKTVAASARSVEITGLACGTDYRFVVTAVGASGEQVSSGRSAAATPCVTPSAPGSLTAKAEDGGAIALSWKASSGGGTVSYAISWKGGSATTRGTSYTAAGLTYLQNYTFTVKAKNAAGMSAGASVTARSGGGGARFSVDLSLSECVGDPNGCTAAKRSGPSHSTAAIDPRVPHGATVTGYCYRSDGSTNTNKKGETTTYWILVEYGGNRGFVSTHWLGGASAWQRVPQCPAGYTA